jgi:hypothetical protein
MNPKLVLAGFLVVFSCSVAYSDARVMGHFGAKGFGHFGASGSGRFGHPDTERLVPELAPTNISVTIIAIQDLIIRFFGLGICPGLRF